MFPLTLESKWSASGSGLDAALVHDIAVDPQTPNVPQELARVIVTDDTTRWYEFDITNFINQGRATTGVLLRNMLRGEAGDIYTVFNSREAAENKPQLVVQQ